jgi:hypothetical protein
MVGITVQKRFWNAWPCLLKGTALQPSIGFKGIKEETIVDWLCIAADHVEEIEALLLTNYPLTRVQLDAMWTYVGHKGEKAGVPKNQIGAASGEVLP